MMTNARAGTAYRTPQNRSSRTLRWRRCGAYGLDRLIPALPSLRGTGTGQLCPCACELLSCACVALMTDCADMRPAKNRLRSLYMYSATPLGSTLSSSSRFPALLRSVATNFITGSVMLPLAAMLVVGSPTSVSQSLAEAASVATLMKFQAPLGSEDWAGITQLSPEFPARLVPSGPVPGISATPRLLAPMPFSKAGIRPGYISTIADLPAANCGVAFSWFTVLALLCAQP